MNWPQWAAAEGGPTLRQDSHSLPTAFHDLLQLEGSQSMASVDASNAGASLTLGAPSPSVAPPVLQTSGVPLMPGASLMQGAPPTSMAMSALQTSGVPPNNLIASLFMVSLPSNHRNATAIPVRNLQPMLLGHRVKLQQHQRSCVTRRSTRTARQSTMPTKERCQLVVFKRLGLLKCWPSMWRCSR